MHTLSDERLAAAEAVESMGIGVAWYWERDARAGPYSSESVCIGYARTSDCLVLILADELTDITYKEYVAAYQAGVPCIILLKQGVKRNKGVCEFIARERQHTVYRNFKNLSELRTEVTGAIRRYVIQASRKENLRNRKRRMQTSATRYVGGMVRGILANPFRRNSRS
jgi:hypothetical protein